MKTTPTALLRQSWGTDQCYKFLFEGQTKNVLSFAFEGCSPQGFGPDWKSWDAKFADSMKTMKFMLWVTHLSFPRQWLCWALTMSIPEVSWCSSFVHSFLLQGTMGQHSWVLNIWSLSWNFHAQQEADHVFREKIVIEGWVERVDNETQSYMKHQDLQDIKDKTDHIWGFSFLFILFFLSPGPSLYLFSF